MFLHILDFFCYCIIFREYRYNYIYIKMNVRLYRIGAHIVHPIAMKLSQVVVNIPGVVLEI